MKPRFRTKPFRKRTFIIKHVPTRTISIVIAPTVEEAYRLFNPGARIPFNSIIIVDEY